MDKYLQIVVLLFALDGYAVQGKIYTCISLLLGLKIIAGSYVLIFAL